MLYTVLDYYVLAIAEFGAISNIPLGYLFLCPTRLHIRENRLGTVGWPWFLYTLSRTVQNIPFGLKGHGIQLLK